LARCDDDGLFTLSIRRAASWQLDSRKKKMPTILHWRI
ncbi:MAG: hypothetical protein ACI96M_004133, partial [Candidatus Azotimanducaceae bacterium]